MRVLVTGASGMVGSHLAEYIVSLGGHEVFGLVRWRSSRENLKNVLDKIHLVECDLLDQGGLVRVMREVRPDVIYQLAAQSDVQTSFNAPVNTLQVNVIGTCNLLEAIRITARTPSEHQCAYPRVIASSSSEVYGQPLPHETPITEKNPLRPASPYACSKAAMDLLCAQYFMSYGMPIIRTRLFTHSGGRRGPVFFESAFARQIAAVELGLQEPVLRVGNLDSVRTLCHVKDAVWAYWLLATKGTEGEVYNIGGDEMKTVGEWLDVLMSLSTIPKFEVVRDQKLMRPSDVTLQIPDCTLFKLATNWEPQYTARGMLQDVLDYWREELREKPWRLK